jgi:hypothetical protein
MRLKDQVALARRQKQLKLLKVAACVMFTVAVFAGSSEVIHWIERLYGRIYWLEAMVQEKDHQVANVQNKLEFFESAIQKTTITSYVPYLGGINGNGKVYANGEPVLPIAASRKALSNGSVKLGDYVLLIGQIKDTKGTAIKGHSFDVHAPDLATAKKIGKRSYSFVNLSAKDSPYKKMS